MFYIVCLSFLPLYTIYVDLLGQQKIFPILSKPYGQTIYTPTVGLVSQVVEYFNNESLI